jgi:hypothetical protein
MSDYLHQKDVVKLARSLLKCDDDDRVTFVVNWSRSLNNWVLLCESMVDIVHNDILSIYGLDTSKSTILPFLCTSPKKFDLLNVILAIQDDEPYIRMLQFPQSHLCSSSVMHEVKNSWKECVVCNNTIGEDIGSSTINHLGCGHDICDGCWNQYITISSRKVSDVLRIKCPGSITCNRYLSPSIISQLNISDEAKFSFIDGVISCFIVYTRLQYCPSPRCSVLLCTTFENYITCPSCNQAFGD